MMPGFGELMRQVSLQKVPTAILSRQTAGIRGHCLIVNLPGQPRAISECLDARLPGHPLLHRLDRWSVSDHQGTTVGGISAEEVMRTDGTDRTNQDLWDLYVLFVL